MNQPILLFIDALNPQQNTIDAAVYLAKTFNSPLLLYSVQYTNMPLYADPGSPVSVKTTMETSVRLEEKARKVLDQLCRDVRQQWEKTECELETGLFAYNIVDVSRWLLQKANEYNPFLLILGKEHDYYWWNRLMATTEIHVVEDSPCPVMIMPPDVKFKGIGQIVYLLDQEELHDEQLFNLRQLVHFSNKLNATLFFFYLPEKERIPDKMLDKAMARIQALTPHQPQFYRQLDPDIEIEDLMKIVAASPADLVAFPFRERSFFQRLFGDDESRQLVLKARTTELVF